jgi:hypothetical protein
VNAAKSAAWIVCQTLQPGNETGGFERFPLWEHAKNPSKGDKLIGNFPGKPVSKLPGLIQCNRVLKQRANIARINKKIPSYRPPFST